MNDRQQGPHQVYDGVIVRSPWLQHDPLFTHGGPSGEYLEGMSRPTQFAKIADGSSKTFFLGEKYVRNDLYDGGGPSDDRGWSEGWDPDLMRSTCFQPSPDSEGFQFQSLGADDMFGAEKDVLYFGAAHASGFNGVFADGSVHTLSYDIDVGLFNALATRSGEEATDESKSVN
jgi:hypothetical protein